MRMRMRVLTSRRLWAEAECLLAASLWRRVLAGAGCLWTAANPDQKSSACKDKRRLRIWARTPRNGEGGGLVFFFFLRSARNILVPIRCAVLERLFEVDVCTWD